MPPARGRSRDDARDSANNGLMAFPLLRRGTEGIALLTVLGLQYLFAARLDRFWSRPARAWRNRLHRWGAPWFASYCRRHGALMIKLGQAVASRPDLLPLAYVDACRALRDQAPARPFSIIRQALARAYEERTAEHFSQIDEVPLAAASFGQVHRATLIDGTAVAIKVQYPDLGPRVAMDLALLRITLRLFSLAIPGWPTHLLYEEISRTSREEQDYLCEATAAERLRPLLAKRGIAVPHVRFEHTRDTVLVMEFAAGTTLASLPLSTLSRTQRQTIANRIIDAWLDMALVEGFFHGDPHGGNLIVDGDRLWLIDFGMTASLGPHERLLYAKFLRCVADDDSDSMVDVLAELGVLLPGADLAGLKILARELFAQLATLNPRTFKGSRREAELSAKVQDFLRRSSGIAFPRHTILLSRALSLVEGLVGELVPDASLLTLAKPRIMGLGTLRGRITDLLDDARAKLRRWVDLPARIEAALAPRPGPDWTPLIAGLVLVAAMQAPDPFRPWAVGGAGLALILCLLKRNS